MFSSGRPSSPSITFVNRNSTAVTVTVGPSASNGGAPANYSIFYRIKGPLPWERLKLGTEISRQDITISPLTSDRRYEIYIRSENFAGYTDSITIEAITLQQGEWANLQ